MVAGVFFKEEDRSFNPSTQIISKSCYTVRANKGPIGSSLELKSYTKFVEAYGDPISGIDDHLVIKQALDRGTTVVASRVAHYTDLSDAATLTALFPLIAVDDQLGAEGSATQESSIGPFTLVDGDDIIITPDGSPEATETFDGAAATTVSEDPGGGATGWNLGGELLNVDVGLTGSELSYVVAFDDAFSPAPSDPDNYTQAEVAAQIEAAVAGQDASVVGNTVVLTSDKKGSGARILVTGGSADAILNFVAPTNGTGNVADLDLVTATEFKSIIDALAFGTITIELFNGDLQWRMLTVTTGASATLRFDAPSLAATKMGLTVGGGGETTGVASSAQTPTLRFEGESPGTWGNGISFTIAENTDLAGSFDITIPQQTGVDTAELHTQLSMDEVSTQYVVTILALNSRVLRAVDLNSAKVAPFDNPENGSHSLAGGDDGLAALAFADFLGSKQSLSGVHGFDAITDAENLFVPGMNDRDTVRTIDIYVADRADMVYFFCNFPNPNDVVDMIAYRNATSPYSGTKFDSSYMAMYGGTITDKDFSNATREIEGSGNMGGVLMFNDTGGGKLATNFGVWFAPAGKKRAKLNSIGIGALNLGTPANADDRASMEAAQINSFVDFGEGPVVHDQRTTQTAPTALKDLNVRRFLIRAAKDSIKAVADLQWDPLDPRFFKDVAKRLKPLWDQFQVGRAVTSFKISCDQTVNKIEDVQVNNTTDLDNGKFRCLIFLKPTRAAREITLVGVITATGASFEEIVV